MEQKIYERQVTKLAIAKRVIDEHQIDRHYKENDLMELYQINLEPEEERQQPILPKDRLFAEQLKRFEKIIFKYHEHDSLLENKSEETLSTEEIQAAWKEFEDEKNRPTVSQQYITYTQQPRSKLAHFKFKAIKSCLFALSLQIQAPDRWPRIRYSAFDQMYCCSCSTSRREETIRATRWPLSFRFSSSNFMKQCQTATFR